MRRAGRLAGVFGPRRGRAVIKRDRLYATVRRIWDASPDALSEEQVADVVSRLEPLTRVDKTKGA